MNTESSNSTFNRKRNSYKAIENLWGICLGICSDTDLNELELTFLELWLLDNAELIDSEETSEIYHTVASILKNGTLSELNKSQVKSAIDSFLSTIGPEYRRPDLYAEAANRLFGFIHGIMADQQLKDMEILELKSQLESMPTTEWPWDHLHNQVNAVLEDGIVTSDERAHLIALINDICNSNILETGSASAMTITLGTQELTSIDFQGASFCFTGKFAFGTRSKCIEATKEKGGTESKNVTLKTHYLVLGTHVSPDWISTSFGRKIQKAKDIQASGHPIKIITEANWARLL